MEHENNYASKGQAALNTVLASIGTAGATGILGNLGNVFNGGGCGNSHYINRYEMDLQQQLAAKDTRIGLLESNIYTDSKIAESYERLNTKFESKISCLEAQINQQAVYNATNNAVVGCIQGQVAELMGLTKRVVPNPSICPGWGDVTVSVTPTTTTTTGA